MTENWGLSERSLTGKTGDFGVKNNKETYIFFKNEGLEKRNKELYIFEKGSSCGTFWDIQV